MSDAMPRKFWKRVIDVASILFVIFWFYWLMRLGAPGWRWTAKLAVFTIPVAAFSIFWTIALLARRFPDQAAKLPKPGSARFVAAALGLAVLFSLVFRLGRWLLNS